MARTLHLLIAALAIGSLEAAAIAQDGAALRDAFVITPDDGADPRDEHAPLCSIIPGIETERGVSIPYLWPGGVVPYVFHANTTTGMQAAARSAMDEIEAVSAVRFVPRTTEFDYIHIQDSNQNSATVGWQGGPQSVNVVSWGYKFIIVHELLHSLGMWHEQQRTDRDQYVAINWSNIQAGQSHNFTTRAGTNHGPYDFDSVMHYGQCAFSICACSPSCRTITALPGYEQFQGTMGQFSHLSDGDIATLVALYDGGAVENLNTGAFYGTLTDAIADASPGDVLESEPGQFSRRPDYDLDGKALTVRSTGVLQTASPSNFVLADLASLEAGAGEDMRIYGALTVPAGAAASAAAESFELFQDGAIEIESGAAGSLVGHTRVELHGDLTVAQGGSLLLGAPVVTIDVGASLDLGDAATLSSVGPALLAVDGEALLGAGATLRADGPMRTRQGGALRLASGAAGVTVEAAALDFSGVVEAQVNSQGTLRAASVAGDGSLVVSGGAALTIETDAFTWNGDGVITVAPSGLLIAPSASSSLAIDGKRMTLQDGGRFESASQLAIGALLQPGFFDERTVSGTQSSPQAVAIGDIDDDGLPDITVVSLTDGRVAWYRNNPQTPTRFGIASLVDAAASGPISVELGDIDGDDDPDIAVASTLGAAVYWYEHNGGASPVFVRRTVATGLAGASSVWIADLDADGDQDVLSTARTGARLTWHENVGGSPPAFVAQTIDASLSGATDVEVADMDGDGDLDIVASAQTAGEVAWYERTPGLPATFTKRPILASGGGAYAIALGDLNADDAMDIVVAERSLHRVTLLLNDGAASPAFAQEIVGTPNTPTALDLVDLDGDGDLDVLAASLQSSGATWYANDGASTPTFLAGVVRSLLNGASGIAGGDLDGDGDADVVVSATSPSRVVWQEQQRRLTRIESGATLMSLGAVDHHRALELAGGAVDAPTLRILEGGRLSGSGSVSGDLHLAGVMTGIGSVDIGGSLHATLEASLELEGAIVAIAGDLSIGAANPASIDLSDADLTMGGAPASVLEAASADAGPASAPVLASLRIAAGATVDLADAVPNALAARDAIYTGELIVEPGATLRTNGVRIYYGALTLDGAILGEEHAAALQACAGDLTGGGLVDGADLGLLLGLWGSASASGDLNADGVVDGADLGLLLGSWGACD